MVPAARALGVSEDININSSVVKFAIELVQAGLVVIYTLCL